MNKISAVYKIMNTITGDFYVGSSKDLMRRWMQHKRLSIWKRCPNSKLYKAMEKYGLKSFRFQILVPVMPEYLKQVEQELIEMLRPTYNNYNAKGMDIGRYKKSNRKYIQSDKGKEVKKKAGSRYNNQLCSYNGKIITLSSLASRFHKAGIKHATLEAKKYLKK